MLQPEPPLAPGPGAGSRRRWRELARPSRPASRAPQGEGVGCESLVGSKLGNRSFSASNRPHGEAPRSGLEPCSSRSRRLRRDRVQPRGSGGVNPRALRGPLRGLLRARGLVAEASSDRRLTTNLFCKQPPSWQGAAKRPRTMLQREPPLAPGPRAGGGANPRALRGPLRGRLRARGWMARGSPLARVDFTQKYT